jgi:cytochrome c-type biogenesis protein CcmH/NrfG
MGIWDKLTQRHRSFAGSVDAERGKAADAQAHHHYRRAIALWAEVAERCPGDPEPYRHLGEIYERVGDREAAVQHLAVAERLYVDRQERAKAKAVRRMVEALSPGYVWPGAPRPRDPGVSGP